MKTSGKCPKCQGTDIITNEGTAKSGERFTLYTGWKHAQLSAYICLSCGFVEEYITNRDLRDEKMIEKLRSKWQSHRPA